MNNPQKEENESLEINAMAEKLLPCFEGRSLLFAYCVIRAMRAGLARGNWTKLGKTAMVME